MTITQALATFCIAAGLLTIAPGLDTALVLRTAAAEGPKSAALAALGVVMGCLTWGAAVAFGLGALLAARGRSRVHRSGRLSSDGWTG